MTRADAERYASQWIAHWNARDLAAVLAHFEDEVVFTSPRALAVAGAPTLRGKAALEGYWRRALAGGGALRFTLRRVAFDPVERELVIFYEREADGKRASVAEALRFSSAGRVAAGEVFHGVSA